jgi:hypothetical protein
VFSEVLAINRIAIPQQVAWELVEWERVPQLLAGPLGGWVAGHVEVEDATTIVSQDQKHVEDLKANGRDRKESTETSCEMWFSRNVRQV